MLNDVSPMPGIDEQGYNPGHLLDVLSARLQIRSDVQLARMLNMASSLIKKIRHRMLPVGALLLMKMHEVSQISIDELRFLMGDRRRKVRLSVSLRK